MKRLALLALCLCAAAWAAREPAATDFAWRGTLDTAGRTGLLRIALPPQALARLQSPQAADLRVFDAQGRAVPFAQWRPAPQQPARAQTAPFAALPLYEAEPGAPAADGTAQVRITQDGVERSVWVQLATPAGAPPPAARRLSAALFDTRALQQPVSALVVRARLPANAPVRITVATSADLGQWQEVPVQGPLYRFDGPGAPSSDRLELAAPLHLHGRYLRLAWTGQPEVAVEAVVGLLPRSQPDPPAAALTLGEPHVDGAAALEWELGFATPLRSLHLATVQPNTLVPLRVLGRAQPSAPWRLLAHTVVYRLGTGAGESTNAPLELPQPSVRWLRLEATHGARLQGLPLTARVLFDPLELVFVAGTEGPYQLAAGRAGSTATALPLDLLGAATTARVQDLPAARIVRTESAPVPRWARWLPRGVDGRTAGLWLVLGLGVLLLAGVAWALLRQIDARR